jgi:hypothetical protein
MTDKFRLKPLSTGIGIGQLKPAKPEFKSTIDINPSLVADQINMGTQSSIRRVSQTPYPQQSVGTAIRKQRRTSVLTWAARSLVGWFLDAFAAAFTLSICAILGVMAWQLGEGRGLDVQKIFSDVAAYAVVLGPVGVVISFLCGFLIYFGLMRFISGSTIGQTLTQAKRD